MSSTHSPLRISYLDSVRGLAILMVVFGHAVSYSLTLPQSYGHLIIEVIAPLPVPMFILVDGLLFADRLKRRGEMRYADAVKGGFLRLMVPWLIFTAVYTLARYAFESAHFFDKNLIVGRPFAEIAVSAYGSVYAGQMYFLPVLFLIRLLSPLYAGLMRMKVQHFILLFILYVASFRSVMSPIAPFFEIEGGVEPLTHAVWGLQFFLAGMIVQRVERERLIPRSILLPLALFSVLFVSEYFKLIPDDRLRGYVTQYLYLLGIYTLFFSCPEQARFLTPVGRNTMGIYLLHMPFILKGVSMAVDSFRVDPLLSYLLVSAITFAVSHALSLFIGRHPYGNALFGNFPIQKTAAPEPDGEKQKAV